MNRILIVAGAMLLVAVGYGAPQSKTKQQSPPTTMLKAKLGKPQNIPAAAQGWTVCPQTPEALAKQLDDAISWLKNIGAAVLVTFQDKDGHGRSVCKVEIKDSKMFMVEYPRMTIVKVKGKKDEPGVDQVKVIADGSRIAYSYIGHAFDNGELLAKAKVPSTTTLSKWPNEFPNLVFSAIRSERPFEKMVDQVRKAGSGYYIGLEERRFDYKGVIVHQKRLNVLKKEGTPGGPFQIQIMCDASKCFPLTILGVSGTTVKTERVVFWSATWGMPKNGFNPSDFVIPHPSKKPAKKK